MTLQSNNSLVKSIFQAEREIIFIDATVEDYQSLIAGINPDTKVVILDQMKDGISQITENLQSGKYKAVHIVSHGSEGSLQLGSKQLNSSNLDIYKSQLQLWANYLTDDADILLYGCDVAAGKTGVGFVQQLSQLTGADVAASDDLTGNAALGGDWDLEVKTGKIETTVAFTPEARSSYRSILPSIYINEILFNPPSNDSPNEYIELRGTPNTTIPTGTYLVGIEGDAGSNPGDVQNIFDLSGKTFGSNGFLVLLQKSNLYSVNSSANALTNSGTGNGWGNGAGSSIGHSGDTSTTTEIENASASFLLIQTGFSPSLSDDIDSDDNGTPDGNVYSSWTVLDSVAVLDGSSATDRAYGSIVFRNSSNGTAQSGATIVSTSFEAGYVGRIGNTTGSASTDWVASSVSGSASSFALGTGTNTSSASFANRSLIHIGSTNFPTNTAPTLNNTGNPILNIIAEDIADTSNGGTLVSAILASGASGNPISDVDGDARKGIAVTYVDKSNGTWEYSVDNGANWIDFGTPALNAARLLPSDANTKIRFRPNTNFSGTADINFYAWDQTTGTSGTTADLLNYFLTIPTSMKTGSSTAFSTAYEGAFITVNPVNDTAPTLGAGTPTLTTINEDELLISNKGTSVANLIKGLITDTDKNPQGIAVTGVDNSNGTWQYTLDGGANWINLGTLSDSSATLLSAGVVLYDGSLTNLPSQQGWLQFGNVPSPLPGTGSQTTISGGSTQLVSTTAGATGYSNYNSYTPVLLNQSFPVLDRTKGFTVSFDLKVNSESHSSDDNSDGIQDRAGFSVIVVTSDNTKAIELGFWENEIWVQNDGPNVANGLSKTLFTHSNTERAFQSTTKMTRYDLAIKGDTYQLFAAGGTTPILAGSLRDYTAFDHTTAAPIITSLPFDPYETPNFLYFGDNTSSAQANVNLARVELQANNKVRFVPNTDYNGTADIKFRAWDGTDGKANGTTGVNVDVNGGTTAYSSGNKTATIAVNPVNDAPVVQANKTITLNEDASNTPLNITAPTDVDGDTLTITVTGLSDASKGKVYLTDGTTQVNNNQILTAAQLTGLLFRPVADANGSAGSFSYSANDGTVSSSQSITFTVNSVNDRPSFTIGGNQSVKTGVAQTINGWAYNFNSGAANETQSVAGYTVTFENNLDNQFFAVAPTIDLSTGDLKYTPTNTITSSKTVQFKVTVQDNGGTANGLDTSIEQTFKITINPTATNTIKVTSGVSTTGTDQNDFITGLDGIDTIIGGLGNDYIFGGKGNDILYGDLGINANNSDIIPDYGSNLTMNDTIYGGDSDDFIYGNVGNDKLYGDAGNDTIWGGNGDDIIWGGLGNDTFWGGADKDSFVLVRGQGKDTIEDFKIGEDVLGCAGGLRYDSLVLGFKDVFGGTSIFDIVGNQELAFVKNITMFQLNNSSNFRLF
jgi:Ca2+-binding RTX toxin-like protein